MCQETLELHHGKHHQAYVTALNGFVTANAALQGKTLDEIVKLSHGDAGMAGVFNNAGQHWNHIIFWANMSASGGGIPGKLDAKINADFGKVRAMPDIQKRMQELGFTPEGGTAEEFGEFVKADIARWRKVVKDTGVKVE